MEFLMYPIVAVFALLGGGSSVAIIAYLFIVLAQKIKNKIKIIVAQRITSVVDADKILVIENGKITEEGTHEQLVENGGYYTSIYNISQQGSSEVIQ